MTQKQNYCCWRLGLSIFFLVGSVSVPIKYVLAQPIPDRTLGTESSIINNVDDTNSTQIDGGASRGSNLFHSFEQFNIGEEQTVLFNSPPGIVNILTRVTGGNPSEILGSIGVIGDANLFLINPKGIIFGANASLDLRGSFVASTANSVIFSDGVQYSATNPQASSLLTVNTPTGLQYGGSDTSIRIQGATLDVKSGQTLGLIGGEVRIEGGNLLAPEGRIEVGSVASNIVTLNPIAKGWSLGYENVANFQNISITKGSFNNQSSVLDTSGDSGGDISLQGKQILLADTSQVFSTTDGAGTGGNLIVNASEFFLIKGLDSLLSTSTTATGSGGNITVNTGKLILEDRASILTDSSGLVESPGNIRFATGKGGNLTVNASISVELRNGSSLSSSTLGSGDAGNININTASFIAQDDAGVAVSSTGTGNAGKLTILARTISLDNRGQLTSTSEVGKGGGDITLQNVDSLILQNNSSISTNAQGEGNGGNIAIATDLLTALGNSSITANATDSGNGGKVSITTQGLFLSPNSKITATSKRGIDGEVEINKLENDPNDNAASVPVEPVDLAALIATGCGARGSIASKTPTSKFIITGRGGLPPSPTEALRSDVALADLGTSVKQDSTARIITAPKQITPKSIPIMEAQGWVVSPKGQVVLTASAPDVTPEVPWLKSPSCHNS